jgi:hypothetical protein
MRIIVGFSSSVRFAYSSSSVRTEEAEPTIRGLILVLGLIIITSILERYLKMSGRKFTPETSFLRILDLFG